MPLRAKLRAAAKVVILLGSFGALVAAAILSEGTTRIAFAVACALSAAIGIFAAYIYIPGFDLLARIPWKGRPGRGFVAITFDDGPNEPYTTQVLDTLARYDAKATFFLLGEAVDRFPDAARRIAAEGHAVGTHTYHHQKLHFLGPDEIARDIDLGEEAAARAGVETDRLFRAPHGLKSPFLPSILRRRGLRLVAWTDGVWDTDCPGAGVIAARALAKLRDGEVLLLHDGKPGLDRSQTAQALETILQGCRARGLRCVTIPQLFEAE